MIRIQSMIGLSCLCILLVSQVNAADTITLTDGKQVRGEFVSMSPIQFTLKPTVGEAKSVPVNEIETVEWSGEPADLRLARNNEKNGAFDKALQSYQIAAGAAKEENFRTDLEFLIARVHARMALTDPTKLEEAVKMMSSFVERHDQNFRHFAALGWLSELYMAQKDVANAEATLAKLAKAPWQDYKMAAQISQGKLKLSQGNIDGAMADFKAVGEMNAQDAAQKSRKLEALLGQSNCLVQKKDYDNALTVLDQVGKEASEDDVRVQAEVYLRKGDCHLASDAAKAALLAYLHVDVLFFQQGDLHAEALYHLAKLWGKTGNANRGEDAARRLQQDYANSEWAKKLKAGN